MSQPLDTLVTATFIMLLLIIAYWMMTGEVVSPDAAQTHILIEPLELASLILGRMVTSGPNDSYISYVTNC